MFAISCKRSLRFSPNFITRLGGEQDCTMKGGEEMDAEKHLMEKERLSRALNGHCNYGCAEKVSLGHDARNSL